VCLDDKALVYVNWLEGRDKLNVVGDFVTIVKKHAGRAEDRSKLQRHQQQPAAAPHDQRQRVGTSLGPAIDEYFDTHTLRISLPWILDDDIDLELDQQGESRRPRTRPVFLSLPLIRPSSGPHTISFTDSTIIGSIYITDSGSLQTVSTDYWQCSVSLAFD